MQSAEPTIGVVNTGAAPSTSDGSLSSLTENGLIHLKSGHDFTDTVQKLESILLAKSLPVLARIDHSGDAAKAGLTMLPTKLFIFGNAKAGTPLMIASPTVAIDLPLKVLIWQDKDGTVWLSYNSPQYLEIRHAIPAELLKNIAGIAPICEEAAN